MIQGLDRYLTTEPDNGFTNFCEIVLECHDFMFTLLYDIQITDDSGLYNQLLNEAHSRGWSPKKTALIIERIFRKSKITVLLDPIFRLLLEEYAERLPKETASVLDGIVVQISESLRPGTNRYYYTFYRIIPSDMGKVQIQFADSHTYMEYLPPNVWLPKLVWSNLSREYKDNISITGRLVSKYQ